MSLKKWGGQNNISSDLKKQLLSKSKSNSEYSFCKDDTFNESNFYIFKGKGNGLYNCVIYENALKERCEKDFGPYDSKNECILVNLYGVDYESYVNPFQGNWFNDLQKMIGYPE